MAFKINTSIYKITPTYSKPQEKKQQFSLSKPQKPKTLKPQKSFPQQNLLDKYQARAIFFNTQNLLRQELKIQKISFHTNFNEGNHLLLEYLQMKHKNELFTT
ncbi:hypothetical protein [Helicobacter apodemus]|uniref:Uncharacterized protein n=1 Tax=Helicobacter apodemus TaxID=135569 RepID=A0A2U8FE52_9HELI|nr:hypothetical protein [Helicobacter apodemus]AWI34502.1 hypothetical protein CDV25_06795 [Helicobacter apodemus]